MCFFSCLIYHFFFLFHSYFNIIILISPEWLELELNYTRFAACRHKTIIIILNVYNTVYKSHVIFHREDIMICFTVIIINVDIVT